MGRCEFSLAALQFKGTPTEQAQCLLRTVRKFGRVDTTAATLPAPLGELVGQPTGDLKARLSTYIASQSLDAEKLGGPLSGPLSKARGGDPNAPSARYFVIHDTSSPYLGNATAFPPDDSPQLNRLSGYAGSNSVAHLFVNRKGETLTGHDFSVPWRATKLETAVIGVPSKGLFLHVELLQPRRREPTGGPRNDAIAPMPGFTKEQYQKLALLYAVASGRGGVWLTPAFHAALDEGLNDGHDDPQNFDLAEFARALSALRAALNMQAGAVENSTASVQASAAVAPDPEMVCSRLLSITPATVAKGADLMAGGQAGRAFKELYDACDADDRFAGKALPARPGGGRLKCSTDKNRVAYAKKFDDGTILFNAKMSVDADGSPVVGGSGWPNNVETWLEFDRGSARHFVNAEDVSFVVVPIAVPGSEISFQRQAGIGKGDLAVVFGNGKCSFGVVGDAGPWFRLGEASLKSHEELGNPQCAVAGEYPCRRLKNGSGIGLGANVSYLIFPATRPVPLLSQTVVGVARSASAGKAQGFLNRYQPQ